MTVGDQDLISSIKNQKHLECYGPLLPFLGCWQHSRHLVTSTPYSEGAPSQLASQSPDLTTPPFQGETFARLQVCVMCCQPDPGSNISSSPYPQSCCVQTASRGVRECIVLNTEDTGTRCSPNTEHPVNPLLLQDGPTV